MVGEWPQQGGGLAGPVGQRRTVKIKPFSIVELALTIERKLVGTLLTSTWSNGPGRGDRARWAAIVTWPGRTRLQQAPLRRGARDAVHDEAARHLFQIVGHFRAVPRRKPSQCKRRA